MKKTILRITIFRAIFALILGIGVSGTVNANWIPYEEWISGFDWPPGGWTYSFNGIDELSPTVKAAKKYENAWRTIGEAQWTEDFVGGPLQYTTWSVKIQESTLYPGIYYLQPYRDIDGYNCKTTLYIDATNPQKVLIGNNYSFGEIGEYDLRALVQAIPEQCHGEIFDDYFTENNYGKLDGNTISFPPGAFWLFHSRIISDKYGSGEYDLRALRRPVDGCGLTIKLPDPYTCEMDYSLKIIDDEIPLGRNPPVPDALKMNYLWSIGANYGLDVKNIYCKIFTDYPFANVPDEAAADVIATGDKATYTNERRTWFDYPIYKKPSGIYTYVMVATNRDGEVVRKRTATKCWQEYLEILRNEDLRWSNWLPSKVETVTYSDDIFASAYPEKYPYTKPYEVQLRAIKNLPGFLILRDPYTTTRTGLVECQWDYYKETGAFPEGPYDILIDIRNPDKVRIPCCQLGISNGYGYAMIESVEAYNRRMGLPEGDLYGTFKDGQLYFPPGSIYYYELNNPEPRPVNLNDRFNFTVSIKPYLSGIDEIAADDEENSCAPEGIFNLQGVRLSPTATEADINALTPGLYIINGRKIMIRR